MLERAEVEARCYVQFVVKPQYVPLDADEAEFPPAWRPRYSSDVVRNPARRAEEPVLTGVNEPHF